MSYYKLDVFSDFECIGSACPENCCSGGWIIYVDEASYERYKHIPGEFGDKIRANITGEEGKRHIKLNQRRSCPFLDEKGLCDMYKEIGPENMCLTCKTYPRVTQSITDNDKLRCLQLSCPEVARLLFSKKDKINIVSIEAENKAEPDDATKKVKDLLLSGLLTSLSIVQNRELKISQRLKLLILFNDMLEQAEKSGEDTEEIIQAYSDERQQLALADNLNELVTEHQLVTKLFLIIINHYAKEKIHFRMMIEDVLAVVNKKIASGGLDMEKMLDAIQGDDYELYMEQYMVYILFKSYFEAGKNMNLIDMLSFPVYMYCLNACFLALYTEKKGAPLDFEETTVVYSHLSRFIEHNNGTIEKIKELAKAAGLNDTMSLLGLV